MLNHRCYLNGVDQGVLKEFLHDVYWVCLAMSDRGFVGLSVEAFVLRIELCSLFWVCYTRTITGCDYYVCRPQALTS